jgi:hypothetical protein
LPEVIGPGDGQAEGSADPVADTGVPVGQLTGTIGLEADKNDEQACRAHRPLVDAASLASGWMTRLQEGTEQVEVSCGEFNRGLAGVVGGHGFFTASSGWCRLRRGVAGLRLHGRFQASRRVHPVGSRTADGKGRIGSAVLAQPRDQDRESPEERLSAGRGARGG